MRLRKYFMLCARLLTQNNTLMDNWKSLKNINFMNSYPFCKNTDWQINCWLGRYIFTTQWSTFDGLDDSFEAGSIGKPGSHVGGKLWPSGWQLWLMYLRPPPSHVCKQFSSTGGNKYNVTVNIMYNISVYELL